MPADQAEIEIAIQEGIDIRYLVAPKRVLAEDGRVVGLELEEMKLINEPKADKTRLVPIEGSSLSIPADLIITAIGQRPDLTFLNKEAITSEGMIDCGSTYMVEGYQRVFAAGDALNGPSTVVEAIASGKSAAMNVKNYLLGQKSNA